MSGKALKAAPAVGAMVRPIASGGDFFPVKRVKRELWVTSDGWKGEYHYSLLEEQPEDLRIHIHTTGSATVRVPPKPKCSRKKPAAKPRLIHTPAQLACVSLGDWAFKYDPETDQALVVGYQGIVLDMLPMELIRAAAEHWPLKTK